ncbi:MAG TPA: peptidoglycan synthetase [Arcobacter sp.]|nr:peptidoglycan synthetase [Arcobacter sp.]
MKISSIVDIIDGDLQNTPSISFITQSHTNISKINDGDLFISSSLEEIIQAVKQGAFAIVYDINIDISSLDNEIAWIKVSSIDNALVKLLRFELNTQKLDSYYINTISYDILNCLTSSKDNILFLTKDNKYNFELLKNIDEDTIFISQNKEFILSIYPTSKEIALKNNKVENLIIHSLFETSFSYNTRYFYKLKLPKLYLNNFLLVFDFLNKLELDTSKLNNLTYMNALFINKRMQIQDYGKSNKFILANKNAKTINDEIEFINEYYKYGKLKIIDGLCCDEMLLDEIEDENYNALYIKNRSIMEIEEILQRNTKNTSRLF